MIAAEFDREDILLLSALALLAYGSWLVYRPAGFLIPGVVLLVVALWHLPPRPPFIRRPPVVNRRRRQEME
ncbi:MAG: hypothetical protein AB7Q29_14860 [Vicinamibacterales bacterium]